MLGIGGGAKVNDFPVKSSREVFEALEADFELDRALDGGGIVFDEYVVYMNLRHW